MSSDSSAFTILGSILVTSHRPSANSMVALISIRVLMQARSQLASSCSDAGAKEHEAEGLLGWYLKYVKNHEVEMVQNVVGVR